MLSISSGSSFKCREHFAVNAGLLAAVGHSTATITDQNGYRFTQPFDLSYNIVILHG